jgi:N-acetyl-alpha-D-muramate 1-phosphate uridylyltransferase
VDAMIFAAGLGTRLGSMTQEMPKALVSVGGVPMLERVARRLVAAGADRLIVNTHHLAERIVDFVRRADGFGAEVLFSHEADAPLDTGGGLLHAAALFRGDAPFFVHNADILADLPLEELYETHLRRAPLATLAVMQRETTRHLLFDDEGLFGRTDDVRGVRSEARRARGRVHRLAFAGVHVVEPALLGMVAERGAFSIFAPYLDLVERGQRIDPFRIDDCLWIDIGNPERLAEANRMLERSLH